jgi:hypothetical protein
MIKDRRTTTITAESAEFAETYFPQNASLRALRALRL